MRTTATRSPTLRARRAGGFATALLCLPLLSPPGLEAQDGSFGSAVGGFFTGAVGGAFIAAGTVSARATLFGRPNYGIRDGARLAIPIAAVTAAGATVLGAVDSERMSEVRENAAIGAAVGGVLGLGLGLLFDREKPLALTSMGIAAGILGGTLAGLLDDEDDDDDADPSLRRGRVELFHLRIRL